MNGNIYTGVVVRTSTISAVKDTPSSGTVQKSEIVHSDGPFIALTDENAKAILLANAMIKAKVDIGDPTAPVEVRIQRF